MPEEIIYTRPRPASDGGEACLQAAWATHQFYREVQQRHDFEVYCQRYYQIAKEHQQEAERLRQNVNVLGWFC